MDFFGQGIPLGRWFKIQVILHWTFLLYAAWMIYVNRSEAALIGLIMALLFVTVLVHEFGHALSCKAVGGQANRIILWPLGGIAFVQPPMNPRAWLITTLCGPLVNAILWPAFYCLAEILIVQKLGAEGWQKVAPIISQSSGIGFPPNLGIGIQICVIMWQINKLLLLFNLIPSYPMDGGRILQELLWFALGFPRSLQVAGAVGVAAGAGFIIIGLGFWSFHIPGINFSLGHPGQTNYVLAVIGYLCATQSLAIFRRAQILLAGSGATPSP